MYSIKSEHHLRRYPEKKYEWNVYGQRNREDGLTSGFGRLTAFLGSFLATSFFGVDAGSFLALKMEKVDDFFVLFKCRLNIREAFSLLASASPHLHHPPFWFFLSPHLFQFSSLAPSKQQKKMP